MLEGEKKTITQSGFLVSFITLSFFQSFRLRGTFYKNTLRCVIFESDSVVFDPS